MRHPDEWILTCTGRQFWPLDPRPEDVCIEDIAHALAHQCRYSGHTRWHYSVAEHSLHVYDLVALLEPLNTTLQAQALLHDAAEAYLVDLPRPLKGAMLFYRRAERHLQRVILERFGLPAPSEKDEALIKRADMSVMAAERAALMPPGGPAWATLKDVEPAKVRFAPQRPEFVKAIFLQTFHELVDGEARTYREHTGCPHDSLAASRKYGPPPKTVCPPAENTLDAPATAR